LSNVAGSSKSSKRKEVSSNSNNSKNMKRNRVNKQENDDPAFEIEEKHQLMLIEIEKRKMSLQERVTANRKAQAEIEKVELENILTRKRLGLDAPEN
jgi:hypothetical protein